VKQRKICVWGMGSKGLSVSSNGSTWVKRFALGLFARREAALSVSSNGSTWVKPHGTGPHRAPAGDFQYPRTDRRG